jgi:hypothetical protein
MTPKRKFKDVFPEWVESEFGTGLVCRGEGHVDYWAYFDGTFLGKVQKISNNEFRFRDKTFATLREVADECEMGIP